MAKQVQSLLIDDIDGGPADETVTFGLDGASYEIDLSAARAAGLRDTLADYVAGGRRQNGASIHAARGSRRARPAEAGDGPDPRLVRAWAVSRGLGVSARGRIPRSVVEQYLAEQGG